MINTLRKWKRNGSISDKLYCKLYPESEEPLNYMGHLRYTKTTHPSIVSSCGSITYNAAKYLASMVSYDVTSFFTSDLVDKTDS